MCSDLPAEAQRKDEDKKDAEFDDDDDDDDDDDNDDDDDDAKPVQGREEPPSGRLPRRRQRGAGSRGTRPMWQTVAAKDQDDDNFFWR